MTDVPWELLLFHLSTYLVVVTYSGYIFETEYALVWLLSCLEYSYTFLEYSCTVLQLRVISWLLH